MIHHLLAALRAFDHARDTLRALGTLRDLLAAVWAASAPPTDRTLPAPGSAWTGPWPAGCLPLCVTIGDGEPLFVGYLPVPAGGEPDLAGFWRGHADALERNREARA